MQKKGSLVMFIPGALSLFIFIIVLIFLSVFLVKVEPKVDMEVTTSVDESRYQAHTTMNALLIQNDGEFTDLVREYGNADSERKEEIEARIEEILEEEFPAARNKRLIVTFANDDTLKIGEGPITVTRTVVSTPDGTATVQFGSSGVNYRNQYNVPRGLGSP